MRALIPLDLVPLCGRVVASYEVFRDEVARVPDTLFTDWPDYTLDRHGWSILPLVVRHGEVPAKFELARNRSSCPRSFALLDGHPAILVAGFSRLLPGGWIGRHRDYPMANVLRFHLGLRLEPGAGIHMDDGLAETPLGQGMLFDASLEHYVSNPTSQPRDILLLDILLGPQEIAALRALRGAVNLGPTAQVRGS
jgi:beta-hydroxylase